MSKTPQILPMVYLSVDAVIISIAFIAALIVVPMQYPEIEWILIGLIVVWGIIGLNRKLYQENLHNGIEQRMLSYAKSYPLFVIPVLAAAYLVFNSVHSMQAVVLFLAGFVAIDITVNYFLINLISRLRRDHPRHALVAGTGDLAAKISNYFSSNPDYGYKIVGFLKRAHEKTRISEERVVGSLKDIKQYLNSHPVDEVMIALPYESAQQSIREIINVADFHGVRVTYVPDFQRMLGTNFKFVHEGGLEAVNIRQTPLDEIKSTLEKNLFDLLFATGVLIFLAPILLGIALLIKLDSPGPVFYCPERVGRNRKTFKLYKFRTMRENDSASGGTLSTKMGDPRITRVGRILRKYSLDELPQFINVLLGQMSVVGPRPHRHFLNKQMQEHVDKYMVRHYFKPGITGWAQVNGWRGPTETEEQIRQRTTHDLWYIENWSFLLDIKIIWLTVFSRKAHQNAF